MTDQPLHLPGDWQIARPGTAVVPGPDGCPVVLARAAVSWWCRLCGHYDVVDDTDRCRAVFSCLARRVRQGGLAPAHREAGHGG